MGTDHDRKWVNRDLVRQRDHLGVRWVGRLLIITVIALAPMAGYLLQQNECLQLSYEVNNLTTRLELLQEEERLLTAHKAALESLARIEPWATRGHGMTDPDHVVIVTPTEQDPAELLALNSR